MLWRDGIGLQRRQGGRLATRKWHLLSTCYAVLCIFPFRLPVKYSKTGQNGEEPNGNQIADNQSNDPLRSFVRGESQMKLLRLFAVPASTFLLIALVLMNSTPAHADNIWTYWSATSSSAGNPGTAVGDLSGVTVTYSGQFQSVDIGYPSWDPTTTFTTSPPPPAGGIIHMQGGSDLAESITFSAPVVNPLIAIWSLGQSTDPASFNFNSSEPFTIIAGGPGAEYGGSSITQSGNNVLGAEGNGVVQFIGTYSEIDFTTPGFEDWYGFTVGEAEAPPVPEPETFMLFGLGMAALPLLRCKLARRRA
jgi:hypothetical protein